MKAFAKPATAASFNSPARCSASNPARSGPYSDRRFCVDRYDDAARRFLGKPAADIAWGTKIEFDDVMALVTVDDAIAAFERRRDDLAAIG